MLVTFDDKGCRKCPLLRTGSSPGGRTTVAVCNLDRRETADGEVFDIKIQFGTLDTKPAGCPFTQYIGSFEVSAMENR